MYILNNIINVISKTGFESIVNKLLSMMITLKLRKNKTDSNYYER